MWYRTPMSFKSVPIFEMRARWIFIVSLLCFLLVGCGHSSGGSSAFEDNGQLHLKILSGSENKSLEPIINRFASDHHVSIDMTYLGSVDMMSRLQSGNPDADAVWPANRIWIAMGDKQHLVKNDQSMMWSPVVLGVKKSVAQQLGWVGKKNVSVEDILKASEGGQLRFMMTSATQSNSGASAYLGFLYAFAGKPDVLTEADLNKPQVRANIKKILGAVNRSSGSSGWLEDLFLQKYDVYDAMVNYESLIIETNQKLQQQGKEPLYAIYPSDGTAIADSPLGFIDTGDSKKAELFKQLQDYLLSDPVQQQIRSLGRRTGPVGQGMKDFDRNVFNPDWGIDVSRFLNQIRYPKADTIRTALDLYQTSFRKPSYTVYCLDFSGSMQGDREESLKSAMRFILDQKTARENLLQATPDDVTTVIAFSDHILQQWQVKGNDAASLRNLWSQINALEPGGGTDIYSPVMRAMDLIKQTPNIDKYFPAIILLTDGESNTGASYDDMMQHERSLGLEADVPVFSIKYGEASKEQMGQIAQGTSGKVFEGKGDLTQVFRDVKGYN